jgi:hypothetical protein
VNLSDRVRANVLHFMEAKGWTYADLGRELDPPANRRYVWHMLADRSKHGKGFSASRIDEFALAFGVDVGLLCREPSEFRPTEEER